jgi:hypothetical protein
VEHDLNVVKQASKQSLITAAHPATLACLALEPIHKDITRSDQLSKSAFKARLPQILSFVMNWPPPTTCTYDVTP